MRNPNCINDKASAGVRKHTTSHSVATTCRGFFIFKIAFSAWRGRRGMARHGAARTGRAGQARRGGAWIGLARQGMAGMARHYKNPLWRKSTEGF